MGINDRTFLPGKFHFAQNGTKIPVLELWVKLLPGNQIARFFKI